MREIIKRTAPTNRLEGLIIRNIDSSQIIGKIVDSRQVQIFRFILCQTDLVGFTEQIRLRTVTHSLCQNYLSRARVMVEKTDRTVVDSAGPHHFDTENIEDMGKLGERGRRWGGGGGEGAKGGWRVVWGKEGQDE